MKHNHVWVSKEDGKEVIILGDNAINVSRRAKPQRMVVFKLFTRFLDEQWLVKNHKEFVKKYAPKKETDND